MKILSIITASKYPEKIACAFDNLQNKTTDLSSFEFLVKVDIEDPQMIKFIENEKKNRPFEIKYIVTPRLGGYYTIHLGIHDLFNISSKETYFIWNPNDSIRIATDGWDVKLKKYIKYFPDDIFQLRITERNKNREYNDIRMCLAMPDNFSFYTRKWFAASVPFVNCWGGDAWQECINFYLKKMGYDRGLPISDIQLLNEGIAIDPFEGLSDEEKTIKNKCIGYIWNVLSGESYKQIYKQMAEKLIKQIEGNR